MLPEQSPAAQTSPVVQLLPSSHDMPSFVGMPPTHAPARHVVPLVHALESSQARPSLPGCDEQMSKFSSQLAIQHPPGGAQTVGTPPPHTPLRHDSSCVQNWK